MNTLTLTQAAGFLNMHPEEVRSRAKHGLISASTHAQGGTPRFALKGLGGWASVEMARRYTLLAADHYVKTALSTLQPARVKAVQ